MKINGLLRQTEVVNELVIVGCCLSGFILYKVYIDMRLLRDRMDCEITYMTLLLYT